MADRSRDGSLLASAGVLIVVLVAALLYVSRQRAQETASLQRVSARLEALEVKVDEQAPNSGAGAARSSNPAAPLRVPYPPLGHVEMEPMDPARELQRQEVVRRELDAQFSAQAPAPRTDLAPQLVVAAFNSDNVVGALDAPLSRNVECRARGCLIQATFAAGDDVGDWATRVMLELGTALPDYRTVNVPQPDGGYEIRIYASRPSG